MSDCQAVIASKLGSYRETRSFKRQVGCQAASLCLLICF
jgi:hypothetical protein